MLATIVTLAIAATSATQVSVRTAADYIVGSDCDPEIVSLFEPSQIGVVEAACDSVSATPQAGPTPDVGPDEISVTLGETTYFPCRLVTMQRNHYPDHKGAYTAWSFACETP